MLFFWTFYSSKYLEKCIMVSTTFFNIIIIRINVFDHHIIILEWYLKDYVRFSITGIHNILKYIQIENGYFKLK